MKPSTQLQKSKFVKSKNPLPVRIITGELLKGRFIKMARRSRMEKYPDTNTFHYFNANPKNWITGDCTFRAIATAFEKPWNDIVMDMAQLSIKTGYAINDVKGIEKFLNQNGWIKQKQPRKLDNTKYTGAEFCNEIQNGKFQFLKNERIIAKIGGHHIVAIVDGQIWDIWNSTGKCIGNWWIKEK